MRKEWVNYCHREDYFNNEIFEFDKESLGMSCIKLDFTKKRGESTGRPEYYWLVLIPIIYMW